MRVLTAAASALAVACLAVPAVPAMASEADGIAEPASLSSVDVAVPAWLAGRPDQPDGAAPLPPAAEPPSSRLFADPTPTEAPPAPPGQPLAPSSPAPPTGLSPGFAPNPLTAPTPVLPSPEPVGYDVSWPQCAQTLPTVLSFAVVGVNGGLANSTNPCLASQLAWAAGADGQTREPPVSLYVNTANPPPADAAWWPTSNSYPVGSPTIVPNPYGVCTGGESPACSYIYGYAKAHDNATIRGVPNPASYFWWLDVETDNSWSSDEIANRAALEGMTHYYRDILKVAGVGIYSTGYQWARIVGGLGAATSGTSLVGPSNLNGLPSWIAGASSLAGARANCSQPALTGGTVTVTQYVMNNLDHNLSCP